MLYSTEDPVPSHFLCSRCQILTPYHPELVLCHYCLPTTDLNPLPTTSSLINFLPASLPSRPNPSYVTIENCMIEAHWIRQGRSLLPVLLDPETAEWCCAMCYAENLDLQEEAEEEEEDVEEVNSEEEEEDQVEAGDDEEYDSKDDEDEDEEYDSDDTDEEPSNTTGNGKESKPHTFTGEDIEMEDVSSINATDSSPSEDVQDPSSASHLMNKPILYPKAWLHSPQTNHGVNNETAGAGMMMAAVPTPPQVDILSLQLRGWKSQPDDILHQARGMSIGQNRPQLAVGGIGSPGYTQQPEQYVWQTDMIPQQQQQLYGGSPKGPGNLTLQQLQQHIFAQRRIPVPIWASSPSSQLHK